MYICLGADQEPVTINFTFVRYFENLKTSYEKDPIPASCPGNGINHEL
jgi:hypothetical protein